MTDILGTPKSPDGVEELYESEKALARTVLGALQRKYANVTSMTEDVKRQFANEAKGVFAENGLVVSVVWDFDVSDDPNDMNVYSIPKVIIEGRTEGIKIGEFDHERQAHEIQAGVFDGKKGVIDPNTGQLREDSKRKLIL
ncbi:hypothetical protein SEA_PUPPER_164 [Gordonia phage Pupper]|uniref:Uncharacterized protein n=1 Tax=Gordonia phage Pupper TaxID=2571249 RepID=A0A4Y6EIU1_9CAUD|nr:hypothetical protein KHQ83_gp113 [Gordonia phage Pupper]QDF18650.1 hypothetical protein SEA_PUPPER_164 [Gordonia phage Pupper]QDF18882.1 hypothetical protein SEA_SCENTAE_163 [Gordonia phage SCentae]